MTQKILPSKDALEELFSYCPATGQLYWKLSISDKQKAGSRAGTVRPTGYIRIVIRGTHYPAHRIVWVMHRALPPNGQIDHVNGVPGDNRIENLREASGSQNQYNTRRKITNTSGFKGVSWDKNRRKWVARLRGKTPKIHLGSFDRIEDAADAVRRARAAAHGEFARDE